MPAGRCCSAVVCRSGQASAQRVEEREREETGGSGDALLVSRVDLADECRQEARSRAGSWAGSSVGSSAGLGDGRGVPARRVELTRICSARAAAGRRRRSGWTRERSGVQGRAGSARGQGGVRAPASGQDSRVNRARGVSVEDRTIDGFLTNIPPQSTLMAPCSMP